MKLKVKGIHHISVIAQHPQENVEFYTGFLGLRMVKNTLNYDDVSMYHFYYGNHNASGNVSTFFPIPSSEEGKVGLGQVGYQTYSIPKGSMPFWVKRLEAFKIDYFKMKRYGKEYLVFKDPHGFELELVENTELPQVNEWEFNGVDRTVGIETIQSAGLFSSNIEETKRLLTDVLGYEFIEEDAGMLLYQVNDGPDGRLEVKNYDSEIGTRGYGTVHHIALRVGDDEIDSWYEILVEKGYAPTEVKDRKYFRALYFRDRGGILFELSTENPGMGVDEPIDTLGTKFIIPDHQEQYRDEIVKRMAPIEVREIDTLNTYSYRNRKEYEFVMKRQNILAEIKDIKSKGDLSDADEQRLTTLRKMYKDTREDFK